MASPAPPEVPFVPWSKVKAEFFSPKGRHAWRQGEHGALIAPTQVGKTHCAQHILGIRRFVVVLGCKVKDESLESYESKLGYRRISSWPPPASLHGDRARELLWPPIRNRDDIDRWRHVYLKCLNQVFSAGKWTVVLDDAIMLEERLKLKLPVQDNLTMGGNKVSVVSQAQRPVLMTKFTLGACSWAFLGRFDDDEDARSLSSLGGINARRIRLAMASLNSREHELLFVDARAGAGEIVKTKVGSG